MDLALKYYQKQLEREKTEEDALTVIEKNGVVYHVAHMLKYHEWIFCDGLYLVNPKYLEKFLREHGLN